MARAILKFDDREMAIGEDATSFGRTAENTVAFPDNTNISRRHAEIEFKDGRFVVTDLGSSNGTTINGQPISGETELNDGDFITLGNSVIVEFVLEDETPDDAEDDAAGAAQSESVAEAKTAESAGKSSRMPVILGLTGAACGLAIVFAAAASYVYFSGGGSTGCDATARIVSPLNGDVISETTEIRVEVKNSACVSVVRVMLEGQEIAQLRSEPYTAQIDPKEHPDWANGRLYGLSVVLEDAAGNKLPQSSRDIALQFETKKVATPTPTATAEISPTPTIGPGPQVTLIDIQTMTARTVGKFTGASFKYNLSNPEFLKEVQKKTGEYSAAGGYFERAAVYRDTINNAFVRDKNLDPSLGFLLAMSRSKFNPEKQGANEGLWQMSGDFATANAYNVVCPAFNLSETTQECAAKVASFYLGDLMTAFDGDIVYAVAAFGKTPQEANEWKASLPADRADFWKIITDQAQREQVVRFFAAAAVAENPPKFKLKKDRSISELYPTVGK
ncbi:MAG: FHA domain-containing protein [Acidobacteria bacterium]|nr:FHA domain-containing protein [Acidobacteriota bacterium]